MGRVPAGYVGVPLACEIVGISPRTLLEWRRSRKIPLPRQIAGRLCWPIDELRQFVADHPRVTVADRSVARKGAA